MILRKKQAGPQLPTKLMTRVAKIPTSELIQWSENSLFQIGKYLTHYQGDNNPDMLEEAHMGAEALLAITSELKKRQQSYGG